MYVYVSVCCDICMQIRISRLDQTEIYICTYINIFIFFLDVIKSAMEMVKILEKKF